MTAHNGKAGRPNAPTYTTSWGERIERTYVGKDGKLRIQGYSRPAFSLRDERRAVARIKRVIAELTGNVSDAKHWTEVLAMSDKERQRWMSLGRIKADKDGWPDDDISAAVRAERERLRDLILTDPEQASVELRIPHLAEYPTKREKPHFTLRELGQQYLAKARNKQGKPLDRKHKKNTESWWSEFLDAVGVRYARDLTKEKLRLYADVIEQRDCSQATKKNRLVKVKAILNWGLKKTDDTPDLRLALDNANAVFEIPAVESEPKPIRREDFHKLLDHADKRMGAMLLLGLNCAMHGGEIAKTLKRHVDLAARIFEAKRTKTNKPRAAWLWERTVNAIRDYLSEQPHESEFLFVSRTGKPLTSESLRQLFCTLRRQAGLGSDIMLEGLRDAAYTEACQVDSYYAKFVAGHTIKDESAKYVVRGTNARVKACCEAIETKFFGPQADPNWATG